MKAGIFIFMCCLLGVGYCSKLRFATFITSFNILGVDSTLSDEYELTEEIVNYCQTHDEQLTVDSLNDTLRMFKECSTNDKSLPERAEDPLRTYNSHKILEIIKTMCLINTKKHQCSTNMSQVLDSCFSNEDKTVKSVYQNVSNALYDVVCNEHKFSVIDGVKNCFVEQLPLFDDCLTQYMGKYKPDEQKTSYLTYSTEECSDLQSGITCVIGKFNESCTDFKVFSEFLHKLLNTAYESTPCQA